MNIGVIGTGAMGSGIAARLLDRGHAVHARDIDPAREAAMQSLGVQVHASPASLIACVDATFIVVVTADQIEDVLAGSDGVLPAVSRASTQRPVVFLCSTIAPQDTARFADQIAAAGGQAIDAPISGGPARAHDGSMSIMLAAPESVLDTLSPLINDIAAHPFRISDRPGDAAKAKLVNNLAAGVNLAVAAEALAFAERLGLDARQMQKLMAASSAQSWAADDRMPRALDGDFEPRAATRVLAKDLTLASVVAEQADADIPLGREALNRYLQACEGGLSELDDAAMLTYYRQRSAS